MKRKELLRKEYIGLIIVLCIIAIFVICYLYVSSIPITQVGFQQPRQNCRIQGLLDCNNNNELSSYWDTLSMRDPDNLDEFTSCAILLSCNSCEQCKEKDFQW